MYHGTRYSKHAWGTPEEAKRALRDFLQELKAGPKVARTAMIKAVNQWIIESSAKGRSQWRLKALRWNFKRWILPYFGELTPIGHITAKMIEAFILEHKSRVKNSTIWRYITDLRALFNWSKREGLLKENPVNKADLSLIKHRAVVKLPLNLEDVDTAAKCLTGQDRVFFDFLRFTGLRLDEANRLQWEDLDLGRGWFIVRGTKTEESEAVMPLAPVLIRSLRSLTITSEYVFPGRSAQTRGKKVYKRDWLFKRIHKLTGIKLMAKDLRDYFANVVDAPPETKMRLLRHTNLATTTRYLRRVESRLQDAVRNLGATFDANLDATLTQKGGLNSNASDLRNEGPTSNLPDLLEKSGDGGETRIHGSVDKRNGMVQDVRCGKVGKGLQAGPLQVRPTVDCKGTVEPLRLLI